MNTPIITRIRNLKYLKLFSVLTLVTFLNILIFPSVAWSLTSGPAQEEYASFEPANTSDLVNIYSGDFTYNIPLLSVPGPNGSYPINISYHSGIGMEQEASWVGLGWNINVGAINRQLRGIPDDVNGGAEGKVSQSFNLKKNETFRLDIPNPHSEAMGFRYPNKKSLNWGAQIYYNTYRGIGYRINKTLGLPTSILGDASLNLSYDSQDGLDITPSLSRNGFLQKALGVPSQVSTTYNSNAGLTSVSYSNDRNFNFISGSVSLNSSKGFSFSTNHYVPRVSMPMKNTYNNYGFKGSLKMPFFGIVDYGWVVLSGAYENEELKNSDISTNAFGYNYTQNATNSDLKDFERKGIPYSKKIPNIAPSSFTYDNYSISGQGTGGMFRPYRSEVGILSDPEVTSDVEGNKTALELAFQKKSIPYPISLNFHLGIDLGTTEGYSSSGPWKGDNPLGDHLVFKGKADLLDHPEYEPYYYELYGAGSGAETNSQTQMRNDWGEESAIRVDIKKNTPGGKRVFETTPNFITRAGGSAVYDASTNDNNIKKDRSKRGTNIRSLTKKQASSYGSSKSLKYKNGTEWVQKFDSYNPTADPIVDHTSEITVYQEDGMKYSYGLPAYNNLSKSVSFRVHSDDYDKAENQSTSTLRNVTRIKNWYSGSNIIKADGKERLDGFISENSLPKYAHGWLLTSVVSSDYLDITGDGPTDDDLGFWVKFNYEKKISDYQWRVPYTDANFQLGTPENEFDDMGSYNFGKKDVYYLHSVETKTHVGFFELEERIDGREAKSELIAIDNSGSATHTNGTRGLFKLKSIKLFSKSEYGDVESTNPSAIPIKEIHFDYDYSLCRNVANNINFQNLAEYENSGKLTLKEISFNYNGSTRGSLTPYVFNYASGMSNPDYESRDMDRWGNYKANSTLTNQSYPYVDFPYTNQDNAPIADAWHLTNIKLPNGGDLNIEYESDDYAYIEDKKPMQMFDIRSLGAFSPSYASTRKDATLQVGSTIPSNGLDGYTVFFELPKALPIGLNAAERSAYMLDKFLRDHNGETLSKVYFNIEIALQDGASGDWDQVKGYADLHNNEIGVMQNSLGEYKVGYITLKKSSLSKTNFWGEFIHPFRKAAFQHLQIERLELVNSGNSAWEQLYKGLNSVLTMMTGFNRFCLSKNWGENVRLNGNSVIRLYAPIDADNNLAGKYGGGSRVKKLYIEESDFMTGAAVNKYGQTYEYTTVQNGEKISSGVAYEPYLGADESTLRQPIDYTSSTPLKSPHSLFLETPILEDHYPSASVGYSKVTISSIARSENMTFTDTEPKMSHKVATPLTIHEFYTPKDFPIITDQTDLNSDPALINPSFIPGLKSKFGKFVARSQGYSIVLNDMSGKPKKVVSLIPENSLTNPITPKRILSEVEYLYHTKDQYSSTSRNELENEVRIMTEDGDCSYANMGVTEDIYVDMNENFSERKSSGKDWNLEFSLYGPPPAIPPFLVGLFPFTSSNEHRTSFRTVVTNKIIYKTGILREVRHFDGNKTINEEILAYNALTKEPVLTRKNSVYNYPNPLEGDMYDLDIKGHWQYSPLKGNYFNQDLLLSNVNYSVGPKGEVDFLSQGVTGTVDSMYKFFVEGDELMINGSLKAHVYKRKTLNSVLPSVYNNNIFLIDENGQFLNVGVISSIEVINSGRKNMLTQSIGNVKALKDPTNPVVEVNPTCSGIPSTGSLEMVYDSWALEYSDDWALDCGSEAVDCVQENDIVNPYKVGLKGLWRPSNTYTYNKIIQNGSRNYSANSSTDGLISDFTMFNWNKPHNSQLLENATHWIATNSITKYSKHGYPIEDKNRVGIPSSAIYGYSNALVTAVGNNAKYEELIYDGFEDYVDFNGCQEHNWTIDNFSLSKIENLHAHTGNSSLKVNSNQSEYSNVNVVNNYCDSSDLKIVRSETNISVTACGCNESFSPIVNKKMYVSVWVKESNQPTNVSTYNAPKFRATYSGGFVELQPTGPIIDGWQKISGKIVMPSSASTLTLSFKNTGSNTVYFDDFRMHPLNSQVKSYVYNPKTLKVLAELDNNNFATFYLYNDEGHLIKINKETEEGIRTLSEGRNGIALKN